MICHISVHLRPLLRKTNLAVWKVRRSWKSSLNSTVCASSSPGPGPGPGLGPLGRSEDTSSVTPEKPPHCPVMLKEVLQYLDVQKGQVCLHLFLHLLQTI